MYLLGTILIVGGIVAALVATGSYGLVVRGSGPALTYGRLGTRAAFGAVLLIVLSRGHEACRGRSAAPISGNHDCQRSSDPPRAHFRQ